MYAGSPTYGLYDNLWLGRNENALGTYDIQSVLQSPAALAVAKTTGFVLTEEVALQTRHAATLTACPVSFLFIFRNIIYYVLTKN
jgi:hypothetical protein